MATTGCLSVAMSNEVLDHLLGVGSYSPPATVYLGFSTANPLDDFSALAEPSGYNYQRTAITFNTAASRQIVQGTKVTFPQASGAWGDLTHWGLFTAQTGGFGMARGALTSTLSIGSGEIAEVAAGEVVVAFVTGAIFDYLALKILDWLFRAQTFTQPAIWVGGSTTIPTDAGGNITEPANGYGRVQVSGWATASAGASSNSNKITLPPATGAWGTLVYGLAWDAETSGNPLFRGDITDEAVGVDNIVEWDPGDFDVSLD